MRKQIREQLERMKETASKNNVECLLAVKYKRIDVLEKWFKDNGFNINVEELTAREDPEYLASAVGLATLYLRGMPLREVNTKGNSNSNIHEELFPLFEN